MKKRVVILAAALAALAVFWPAEKTAQNPGFAFSLAPDDEGLIAAVGRGSPVRRLAAGRPAVSRYEAVLRENARRAADLYAIQLFPEPLDPTDDWPEDEPALRSTPNADARRRLAALSRYEYRLVQFAAPIGPDTPERLRAAGFEPVAFVPNNAYVVAAPKTKADRLARLTGVRWQGAFPAGAKFAPALLARAKAGPGEPETALQVSAWRTETMEGWAERLKAFGVTEVLQRNQAGPPRLILRVQPGRLAETLAALAALPGVEYVREFTPPKLANYGSIWLLQSGDAQHQFTPLFDVGLTGKGQIYAAADSGIDTDGCQFRYSAAAEAQTLENGAAPPDVLIDEPDHKIIAYYVLKGAQAYDETSGGFHGTMTTGCATGDNFKTLASASSPGLDRSDGMAPAAQVVFQDVGSSTGYLLGLMFHGQYDIHMQAFESGARVHNNSYGLENPSTGYDPDSAALDDFIWDHPTYSIFFSAGNSGPEEGSLTGEGSTAKNTIVVGATTPGWFEGGKDVLVFSSRGPTADGRLKPDLMAPGIVESATEIGQKILEGYTNVYGDQAYESVTSPPNNQCALGLTGGTSFSSPTAAGMALLVRQYFADGYYPSGAATDSDAFDPSAALVRAAMLNSARDLPGALVGFDGHDLIELEPIEPAPSTYQGWGQIVLDDTLYLKGDRRDLVVFADLPSGSDEAIVTGQTHEYRLHVKSGLPLKITLAWTDPAGSAGARITRVNDLNLEAIGPSGARYLGNVNTVLAEQKPVGDDAEPDAANNQEQIAVHSPAAGTWTIRVIGDRVPGNGSSRPFDSTKQGYALIAAGDLGEGVDDLGPHVGVRVVDVGGGCDGDPALDKNERITVTLEAANSGDGRAAGLAAETKPIADGTEIPVEALQTGGQTSFAVGDVEAKSVQRFTVTVALGNVDYELCDKRAVFGVTVRDAAGDVLEEERFSLTLGVDYLEDGTITCQTELCDPPAEIVRVNPGQLKAGLEGFTVDLEGRHFADGMTIRFQPDVVAYESLVVYSPQEAVLKGVSVDDDAPAGPVTLFAANPEAAETPYEGFLDIVADTETDGDGTEAEAENAEDETTTQDSSGGCQSSPLPPAWLAGALAALLLFRRKRLA
ncbi:MAG: hypothetical protein C4523_08110 [Myxococcales bacterium]|nr:MAG: hypothetical protein C4523_08110 [Myxococcales bacterium]